jgi:hypothetical protein
MKMTKAEAFKLLTDDIAHELAKSYVKHGDMPENMFEQIVIISEEVGEANKAVLHLHYEDGSIEDVRHELIQTAAMCYKMLLKNFPHKLIDDGTN